MPFNSHGYCSECYETGYNEAIKDSAKIAASKIDPEWPGDDLSVQAKEIESKILELEV